MNIIYYELYYTVNKKGDEIEIVNDNFEDTENDHNILMILLLLIIKLE